MIKLLCPHTQPMTDQELKDLVASLAIAQAKTDAQLAETAAEVREMSRVWKEVSRCSSAWAMSSIPPVKGYGRFSVLLLSS
jgi:hypothetical protein